MASTVAARSGGKGLELVQKMLQKRVSQGGINGLLSKVEITSAENGTLKAVMTVGEEHANVGGTIHGAASTLLVDSLSSLNLLICPGVENTGVSVNLNMTFMKAAAVGEEIEIISRADKTGAKMAFLSVDIYNKRTGDLIVKGSHTKFIAVNRPQSAVPKEEKN